MNILLVLAAHISSARQSPAYGRKRLSQDRQLTRVGLACNQGLGWRSHPREERRQLMTTLYMYCKVTDERTQRTPGRHYGIRV